jgi:four helix bundle protein
MEALKGLEVWQKACRLSVDIYGSIAKCPNRGFADQLGRAGLSIASNIAEGYERESAKERTQFLKIAKGSCAEVWTQVLIGREAGFISNERAKAHADESIRIRKMLFALIRRFESEQ